MATLDFSHQLFNSIIDPDIKSAHFRSLLFIRHKYYGMIYSKPKNLNYFLHSEISSLTYIRIRSPFAFYNDSARVRYHLTIIIIIIIIIIINVALKISQKSAFKNWLNIYVGNYYQALEFSILKYNIILNF